MTKPPPTAVEAVAEVIHEAAWYVDGSDRAAAAVVEFIRDAIHRDGPDADAIRMALGLARERAVQHDGRRSPQFAHGRPVHRVASGWRPIADE